MNKLANKFEYTNSLDLEAIKKISESFNNGSSMDDWGLVTLSDGKYGVELNLSFENGTWSTAFYKMENNGEYFETDYDEFYDFVPDLNEYTWESSLKKEAINAIHKLWRIDVFTWDEIYDLAMESGYGDDELTRKDEARGQMCEWAEQHLGRNIEDLAIQGEIECVEDELDSLDSIYHFVFDESGNIINWLGGKNDD